MGGGQDATIVFYICSREGRAAAALAGQVTACLSSSFHSECRGTV